MPATVFVTMSAVRDPGHVAVPAMAVKTDFYSVSAPIALHRNEAFSDPLHPGMTHAATLGRTYGAPWMAIARAVVAIIAISRSVAAARPDNDMTIGTVDAELKTALARLCARRNGGNQAQTDNNGCKRCG